MKLIQKPIETLLQMNEKYGKYLEKISRTTFEYFGATQLCFSKVGFDGLFYGLNTHHKLWEYYLTQACYKSDPLVKHPNFIREGAYIWPAYPNDDYQRHALEPFSHRFNIGQGITFVVKNCDGYTGFAFGGPKENTDMINKLLKETQLVKRFMLYVEESLKNEIEVLKANRVNLGVLRGKTFYEIPKQNELERKSRIHYLKTIQALNNEDDWLTEVILPIRLSLYVSSKLQKMQYPEIMDKLGICRKTLAEEIKKLKNMLRIKLGKSSQAELMQRLEKLDLIGIKTEISKIKYARIKPVKAKTLEQTSMKSKDRKRMDLMS